MCSTDQIIPGTEHVLQELAEKHPHAEDAAVDMGKPSTVVASVEACELTRGLKSFSNAVSGGLDGQRPRHVKEILATDVTGTFESLAVFVSRVIK